MKSDASFVRFQIAGDAKNSLEKQAARHGMTQTELASRLVVWLVSQPQLIQAAVLNNIAPVVEEDLAGVLAANLVAKAGSTAQRMRRGGKG